MSSEDRRKAKLRNFLLRQDSLVRAMAAAGEISLVMDDSEAIHVLPNSTMADLDKGNWPTLRKRAETAGPVRLVLDEVSEPALDSLTKALLNVEDKSPAVALDDFRGRLQRAAERGDTAAIANIATEARARLFQVPAEHGGAKNDEPSSKSMGF